MKKVLMVTYYWPPAGGPGVHRVLRFAKYLPRFGWQPFVLTVKDGEYPAIDESLTREIPEICREYKAPALQPFHWYKKFVGVSHKEALPAGILTQKRPGWKSKLANWIRLNLFLPDARIGWFPDAVRLGKKIIAQEKPDVIFSSSPPPTAHLIARRLARWSELPWVADFRDPWTNIYFYDELPKSALATKIDRFLERQVLRDASRIVVVNHGFFDQPLEEQKVFKIPNGYDSADLKNVKIHRRNDKFTIRYLGSFKIRQYVDAFFDILAELSEKEEFRNGMVFQIIGYLDPWILDRLREKAIRIPVEPLGYLPHDRAIELIANADLLLTVVGRSKSAPAVVTSKMFEYIMVRKPILAYGPVEGSAARILEETGCGKMFDYEDRHGSREFLLKIYESWKTGKELNKFDTEAIKQYDRKVLTEKLAKIFEEIR